MSYEGWTDWQTWYVHVMIGNERRPNDLMHRIVRGALDRTLYKTPGAVGDYSDEAIYKAVAKLFAKHFRYIRDMAKAEFDEGLQDTVAERGESEARQIEGKSPPPSEYGRAGDIMNEAMDLIRSDMGSGPLPEWQEPNWLEMAEWEVEEEKTQRRSAEAAARMRQKPGEDVELPEDMKEGLRAMGIEAALEGQCDCESIFCEEAGDHRAGRCPRPPQSRVRAFGMRARLCGQCIERWKQTAGMDMKVLGQGGACMCSHGPDDHDNEDDSCNLCDCTGYKRAKEASMSGSSTVGYTIKGKAKVSSFSSPENVGRFVEAATGKWGREFSLATPIGRSGGAVRDWEAGEYEKASRAVEALRGHGIMARLHFHGGGVELVVPEGEEGTAEEILSASMPKQAPVDKPKEEPSWMRYFRKDRNPEPVTSGISQAGPGPRPEQVKAGAAGRHAGPFHCPLCRFSTNDLAMFSKHAADGHLNPEMLPRELGRRAGFNFFFPGQALREFYPEIQHEIVDYPNATNAPMTSEVSGNSLNGPLLTGNEDEENRLTAALDRTFDTLTRLSYVDAGPNASTSPAGGALGNSGKPMVVEGTPLHEEGEIRNWAEPGSFYRYRQDAPPGGAFRREDQDRGGLFEEEFYQHYDGQPGGDALSQLASEQDRPKTAAATGDYKAQLGRFLKRVMAEIAATFISAYRLTSRPPLDHIPGTGEVQLDQMEQQALQGLGGGLSLSITGSRVKRLVERLTDSEIQECINDAWAQAAVWCSTPDGGFVYEAFARAETLDSDTLILKYKFVTGTRE